ncbi:predicted protein [Coccidioides posadasii str. Silveira]|uniref:Predicted protein n=1 Tax=Coccidioides posadasii (strain RMSCC 757 / Silveira) TaxID=443226 RepID=E9DJ53_COCPS|nr:predicted protein [Coccidioides posadasii str. Silveira]
MSLFDTSSFKSRSLTETASSTNHKGKGKGKSKTSNSTSSSHGPKQPSKVRKPQRKSTTTKSRSAIVPAKNWPRCWDCQEPLSEIPPYIQRRIGFVGPKNMIVVQPHRSIH